MAVTLDKDGKRRAFMQRRAYYIRLLQGYAADPRFFKPRYDMTVDAVVWFKNVYAHRFIPPLHRRRADIESQNVHW